jgi:TolB-like protein/tetratricopeptide (TPR) repeat protein
MDETAEGRVLRFAGIALDGARGCLRGPDGVELPLAPKPFDLLMVLARNAGRTMTKDALLDAVWPGVHVTEDSLFQAVREARRAIGDEAGRVLRSVPRRGYLLDVVLPPEPLPPAAEASPAAAIPPTLVPPTDKPSLVVLPFHNMGADPGQEYFADGVVEDITTALSRIRSLFVVASNSAFTYKGRAVDVRQVSRDLGVRYVLEGSVRRAGGQVRIGCQLIEAETGHHVWAERFEGPFVELFALQDRIMEAVVGAVEPSVHLAEIERARRKPTESLGAYDLYMRAMPHFHTCTRTSIDEALRLLSQAIVADPRYALAKAAAASCHLIRDMQGWWQDPSGLSSGAWFDPHERAEGARLAREALAEGRDDPVALALAGRAIVWHAQDREGAVAAVDRSRALSPDCALVLGCAGWVANYVGHATEAVGHFQRAIRLSPLDPELSLFLSGLAMAHIMARDFETAVAVATRAVRELPGRLTSHRALVTALYCCGRLAEARTEVERFRVAGPAGQRILPDRVNWLFADRAFAATIIGALRALGVPE